MRNNNVKKRALLNLTKIIVLALCFGLVFALIMTAEFTGIFGAPIDGSNTDVAFAARSTGGNASEYKDKEYTLNEGATGTVSGDNNELNAVDFKFPGIDSGKKTWDNTELFTKIKLTSSNHQVYRTASDKWIVFSDDGTEGTFYFGIENAISKNGYMMIFRYNLGSFLEGLLSNGYTITAQMTIDVVGAESCTTNNSNIYYFGAVAHDTAWTASQAYSKRDEDAYFVSKTVKQNSTVTVQNGWQSKSVTLDSTNKILQFALGSYFEGIMSWSGREVSMKVSNIKLSFTINYSTSITTKNDGGAPVKVASYYDNSVESYSPFRERASLADSSKWDLYDEWLTGNEALGAALDSNPSSGAVLNSYKSTKINTLTSYSYDYYKMAEIDFADTYNYSSGSFDITKFKDNTNDYRTYAGFGDIDGAKGKLWSTTATPGANSNRFCGIETVTIKAVDNDKNSATKTIEVSTITTPTTSTAKNSSYVALEVGGNEVGYALVSKYGRARIRVKLYMGYNATVTITVTDFGGLSCTSTTVFKGIDRDAPNKTTGSGSSATNVYIDGVLELTGNNDDKNYISDSSSSSIVAAADWYRKSGFTATANLNLLMNGKNSVEKLNEGTPYVWFYTAERADSLDGLGQLADFNGYLNGIKNASDMRPIAYASINKSTSSFTFQYDFLTGKAKGYNQSEFNVVGNPKGATDADKTNAKGVGYYRFTFYVVDAAGNYGGKTSFIVKVDYEPANYTLDLSYIPDGSSDDGSVAPVQIKPSDFNVSEGEYKWATGETTLRIDFGKISFSGNSLYFEDYNEVGHYISFDRSGILFADSSNPIKDESGAVVSNGVTIEGNTVTFSRVTTGGSASFVNLYFELVFGDDGSAAFAVTFDGLQDGKYPDIALPTVFYVYTGQTQTLFSQIADKDKDLISWREGQDDSEPDPEHWQNGKIYVLIDRNAPNEIAFTESEGYLNSIEDSNGSYQYVMPEVDARKWLSNYSLEVAINGFSDAYFDEYSPYVKGLRYAYVYKNVKNNTELTALGDSILSCYRDISDLENALSLGYDGFVIAPLRGADNGFMLDLLSTLGSGMRVIYLWSVDQAGTPSNAVNAYYVLADGNKYSLSFETVGNDAFDEHAQTSRSHDSDDYSGSTFSRGEIVAFDFAMDSGFVPYLFTMTAGDDTFVLLENFTSQTEMTAAESAFMACVGGLAFTSEREDDESVVREIYNLKYRLDSVDDLQALSANSALSFLLKNRKVVKYRFDGTPTMTVYTADNAVISLVLEDEDDEPARSHFVFDYLNGSGDDAKLYYATAEDGYTINVDEALRDTDGNPVRFVPINVGKYDVRAYIPRDDDTYVGEDDSLIGELEIDPYEVTITPISSDSVYGNTIELSYEEIDREAQRLMARDNSTLTGTLKLNVEGWNPAALIDAGTYAIVQDVNFAISDNYKIKFISTVTHSIAQREVELVAWGDSKDYGNPDPSFRFAVDEGQFDWYIQKGAEFTLDNVFAAAFEHYTASGKIGSNRLYNANSSSAISLRRAEGEVVGAYEFIAEAFDLGKNYTARIDVETNKFTINRRTVVLDVSKQSRTVFGGQLPAASDIKPTYRLSPDDNVLSSRIASLLEGKLSVAEGVAGENPPEGYAEMWLYTILLAESASTDNILFVLGNDNVYIVYVAGGEAIIVSLKTGATFELPFGTKWSDNLINYDDFKGNFEVTGATDDEFDTIEWTAAIEGAAVGSLISSGGHRVSIENAKLKKDGAVIENKMVFVDSFNLTITPAVIVVRPAVSAANGYQPYHKVYGDPDSVYGIQTEIVSVNGQPIGADGYAGYTYDSLCAMISGSFARAVYANNGSFRKSGERYDSASNENGIVNGDTDYYAFAIGAAFGSSNPNFVVEEPQIDASVRLIIDRKTVNLEVSSFIGISKVCDNTTAVNYGSKLAYNLSSQLVRNEDELILSFDARYTEAGNLQEGTPVEIIFKNLGLKGASVKNYVLGEITNNHSENKLYILENADDDYTQGTEVASATISDKVCVRIYYIDNILNDEYIYINMGRVSIRVGRDITVSKQYDNSRTLTMANVTVENYVNEDTGAGTTILYDAWAKGEAEFYVTSAFGGKDVGTYNMEISIFFPVNSVQGLEFDQLDERDGKIEKIKFNDKDGVLVTLRRIRASITERIIDSSSFEEIKVNEREYNGSGIIASANIEYKLKEGVIATGDTLANVGLNLAAEISDGDDSQLPHIRYGFGDHTVQFLPVTSESGTVGTRLNDKNYSVDIDDLNKFYSGENALYVHISKAKLMPDVKFIDKEYDGTSNVEYTGDITRVTTLNFAEELASELEAFRLLVMNDGGIDVPLTFVLSAEGVENENVTVVDGVVVAHNVLVRGFCIEETGDNMYRRNYEYYGARYDGDKNEYVALGDVLSDENASMESLEAYEMLGIVRLEKKNVRILANNVRLEEKIYDGTRDAVVTIELAGSGIPDQHMGDISIEADGIFARSIASTNVQVTINNVRLVPITADGEKYINNYNLEPYTERRLANINPRPVVVTADLGSKEYNNSTQISSGNVSISLLDGMIPSEKSEYGVTIGSAYFINKNVSLKRDEKDNIVYDEDGNVILLEKSGAVFNPILRNARGKVSNYVMVVAETAPRAGEAYIAYFTQDGQLVYNQIASRDVVVAAYCYPLPTIDKYIERDDSTEAKKKIIDDAMAANAIVGCYRMGNKVVYGVDSKYNSKGTISLGYEVTYIPGTGFIEQRHVSISADGIVMNAMSTALEKMYDGTNKFFGVRKTDDNQDAWDYDYLPTGISGVIGNDKVFVDEIYAEFDSTDTTANFVIFTPSGITGKDAYNYRIDTAGTARLRAKIIKRTIDVELQDGAMTYGDEIDKITGDFVYKVYGNDDQKYDIEAWESNLFMSFASYAAVMGYDSISVFNSLPDVQKYLKADDGSFELYPGEVNFGDDSVGEIYFVKLRGITSLPTVRAEFSTSKPAAGTTASRYVIVNAIVNNYSFNPVYTNDSNTSSTLTVVKKDLYIAASGKSYDKVYAGAEPSVEIYYLDSAGNLGFAPSENALNVFRVDGKDYYPIAKFGIFNEATGEFNKNIGTHPKISAELEANQKYVIYFELPAGEEEFTNAISNYNVHFGNGKYVVKDGVVMMTYDGIDLQTTASELVLGLPIIDGISLRGVAPYSYTAVYDDGKNLASTALTGTETIDKIYIDEETNIPANAGTYSGYLHVERPIKIDENDNNNYYAIWVSPEAVTIVVERASLELYVESLTKQYDGLEYAYGLSGTSNNIKYKNVSGVVINNSHVDIRYELQTSDGYVEVGEMRDAGKYRVTVELNSAFENMFTNYKREKATATYTILKSNVNVTIQALQYKQGSTMLDEQNYTSEKVNGIVYLRAIYDGSKKYGVKYTIDQSAPAAAQLPISQTEIVFDKQIDSAGRYPFTVALKKGDFDINNYTIVGGNGVIELSTNYVEASNGAVELLNKNVIANRFVARSISGETGSSADVDYWMTVDKYMPNINESASLTAIVKLGLYYGSSIVDLGDERVRVTVDIPEEVGSMEGKAIYTVNTQGGISKMLDYTITEDGKLQFETNYLSALIFVDLHPQEIPLWVKIVVGCGVGLVLVIVIWAVVAWVVRKARLRKLM